MSLFVHHHFISKSQIFLLDTGSVFSILSRDYQAQVGPGSTCPLLLAVNDTPITTYGFLSLELTVSGKKYSHDFIVADISTCIIGYDFFCKNCLTLEFDPIVISPKRKSQVGMPEEIRMPCRYGCVHVRDSVIPTVPRTVGKKQELEHPLSNKPETKPILPVPIPKPRKLGCTVGIQTESIRIPTKDVCSVGIQTAPVARIRCKDVQVMTDWSTMTMRPKLISCTAVQTDPIPATNRSCVGKRIQTDSVKVHSTLVPTVTDEICLERLAAKLCFKSIHQLPINASYRDSQAVRLREKQTNESLR